MPLPAKKEYLSARLTAAERQLVKAMAAQAQTTVSAFVRAATLCAARRAVADTPALDQKR
jgi:uncharacterized protein (DUF1778 family)